MSLHCFTTEYQLRVNLNWMFCTPDGLCLNSLSALYSIQPHNELTVLIIVWQRFCATVPDQELVTICPSFCPSILPSVLRIRELSLQSLLTASSDLICTFAGVLRSTLPDQLSAEKLFIQVHIRWFYHRALAQHLAIRPSASSLPQLLPLCV